MWISTTKPRAEVVPRTLATAFLATNALMLMSARADVFVTWAPNSGCGGNLYFWDDPCPWGLEPDCSIAWPDNGNPMCCDCSADPNWHVTIPSGSPHMRQSASIDTLDYTTGSITMNTYTLTVENDASLAQPGLTAAFQNGMLELIGDSEFAGNVQMMATDCQNMGDALITGNCIGWGMTFENAPGGTLTFDGTGAMQEQSGGATLVNNSLLFKTGAAQQSDVVADFIQSPFGAMDVQEGTLKFIRSIDIDGLVEIDQHATLELRVGAFPAEIESGCVVQGEGTLLVYTQDPLHFKTPNVDLDGTLWLQHGGVRFDQPARVGTLRMTHDGEQHLEGEITVTDMLDCDAGRFVGANVSVESAGQLTTHCVMEYSALTFEPGSSILLDAALIAWADATITNHGSIEMQEANLSYFNQHNHELINSGTITKTTSAQSTVNWAFTNTGLIDVQDGIFFIARDLLQNSGETRLSGGLIYAVNRTLDFQGGLLTGGGETTGAHVVIGPNATISPGSTGDETNELRLGYSLTYAPGAQTEIDIAGRQRGIDYDAVSMTGTSAPIVLDGDLVVRVLNGFESQIQASDQFAIMQTYRAGSITGSFANVRSGQRVRAVDTNGSTVGWFQVYYGSNSPHDEDQVVLTLFRTDEQQVGGIPN